MASPGLYLPARMKEAERAGGTKTSTIVVEGGGLRGAFGAGVLAELSASKTHFDDSGSRL